MKVVILGASSFLGRSLIKKLEKGDVDLVLCSREKQETDQNWVFYEIPNVGVDIDLLLSCDVVIYCASVGVQPGQQVSQSQLVTVNAIEPIAIITTLSEKGFKGKIITFGSYFEIGVQSLSKNYNEIDLISTVNRPLNNYAITKRLLTRFIYDFASLNPEFKIYHFILPNIYGVGENTKRLIPYLISQIRSGQLISLGTGDQKRQYLHIDDISFFIVPLIGNEAPPGIYCLTERDTLTVADLVNMVLEEAKNRGYKLPSVTFGALLKRDSHAPYLGMSDMKAREKLGWSPSKDIKKGVSEYFYS